MATIETRPFAVASPASVALQVELLDPPVSLDDLVGSWEPGEDVSVEVRARLHPDFWIETGIDPSEPLRLTVTATCFSARAGWTESELFIKVSDGWEARTVVTIDGAIAGEQATVDAIVSGPGRTRSADARFAVHDHAKLWESKTVQIPLEEVNGFPTSAVSFEAAGWYEVPWMVEVSDGAEANQSYTASIRLYLNTDLHAGVDVIETKASEEIFRMIEGEIQFAVLHALWRIANDRTDEELTDIAASNTESFAALGWQYAANLGMSLKEAMRLTNEAPLKLLAIVRERQRFLGKKVRKS